jgi:hypothetical protein
MGNKFYIYAYYLPDLHAIKVGHGENPARRQAEYSKYYGINSDRQSLIQWEIPTSGLSAHIESLCHNSLTDLGFSRLSIKVNDVEANEIFYLNEFEYKDACELVASEIDNFFSVLKQSLENRTYLKDLKNKNKKKDIERKKLEIEEIRIREACQKIRQGFPIYYKNFINSVNKAKAHLASIPFEQRSYIGSLFKGYLNEEEEFWKWNGVAQCAKNAVEIFHSARIAKPFYSQLTNEYPHKIIAAAEKELSKSSYSPWDGLILPYVRVDEPYSYRLPMVYFPMESAPDYKELALEEVTSCVSMCSGGRADRMIAEHRILKDLVDYAVSTPAPELKYQIPFR